MQAKRRRNDIIVDAHILWTRVIHWPEYWASVTRTAESGCRPNRPTPRANLCPHVALKCSSQCFQNLIPYLYFMSPNYHDSHNNICICASLHMYFSFTNVVDLNLFLFILLKEKYSTLQVILNFILFMMSLKVCILSHNLLQWWISNIVHVKKSNFHIFTKILKNF